MLCTAGGQTFEFKVMVKLRRADEGACRLRLMQFSQSYCHVIIPETDVLMYSIHIVHAL